MKSIISSHNKHVLSNANAPTPQSDTCNCRKKSDCPLEGKCLQTNVIYQATVTTETATETYVGLATNFKERYRNHKTSFRHSKRGNETQLSKYVWNLQNEKKPFQIKGKILKKCKPYSNINKKCSLCLYEKFIIICKKELCSLNRRNELASSCPRRMPGLKYRSRKQGIAPSINYQTTQIPLDLIEHFVKRLGLGDSFNVVHLSLSW